MASPRPAEEMTCWPVSPRVGNVKNNDPRLIEPIGAMNLHRRLAALFVLLALAGCAQVATIQGQPPNAPYSPANSGEYLRDRGGDGPGGDGAVGM